MLTKTQMWQRSKSLSYYLSSRSLAISALHWRTINRTAFVDLSCSEIQLPTAQASMANSRDTRCKTRWPYAIYHWSNILEPLIADYNFYHDEGNKDMHLFSLLFVELVLLTALQIIYICMLAEPLTVHHSQYTNG